MTAAPVRVTPGCLAAAVTVIACGAASAAAHFTRRHGAALTTAPRFVMRDWSPAACVHPGRRCPGRSGLAFTAAVDGAWRLGLMAQEEP